MRSRRSAGARRNGAAFTLLEVMLAMLIVTLVVSGLAIPLSTRVAMHRHDETRRILDEAREALLGFAVLQGRLPCPATTASRGEEAFAPGGGPSNGNCSSFHDGLLPAATLGLASLDAEGFARDAWDTPSNRIRYAVFGGGRSVGGVANPLTRANGMQQATLAALGDAPGYLVICGAGVPANAGGCGPATNQLTRRAALVLLSLGPTASQRPGAGPDESRNRDGNGVFVSHEAAATPGNGFGDHLTRVPVRVLTSRLVAAGRLP